MSKKKYFRLLEGFTILILFESVATYLSTKLQLLIPGNLLGLLLLFAFLYFKIIPLGVVEEAANLLLDNMMVLFIPLNVGLMTVLPKLKQEWLAVFVSILGSTVLVMIVSAKIVEYVERGKKRANHVKNLSQ